MRIVEEIMPELRRACPSFESRAAGLPVGYSVANQLSELAKHVIALLRKGETAELPHLFAAVEDLILNGRFPVPSVVGGFLGNIVGGMLLEKMDLSVVEPFLGEESRKRWDWHVNWCVNGGPLLDIDPYW